MAALSPQEITLSLATLPEWQVEKDALVRNFTFEDFREAMSFVNLVAAAAELAKHHPDIDIRYNKVRLALSSHDVGGISEKDFALAAAIGSLL